ncbi:PREDICTED: serine-rich adhesin for platelets isoform X2 [Rhagoletis zephyria]|uniref:serine-rich adhesin for platelets isoform X2 n=1 Tax=Rhagoletis zephyria TaxID=28612 RepID=UPI00081185C4|nr:PREDICTED: serine-rich adhesin for platelets isoform X2 [Rhagoletis zephyria]
MPLNKMQRKPSNETLASLAFDSTLDSRMSSAEIPQMELLKVNYVQQCKEVRMPRPISATQQQRQSFIAQNGTKYPGYKQAVTASSHSQFANGAKLNIANGGKVQPPTDHQRVAPSKGKLVRGTQQPLPPPTVESWKFLQHQLPQVKPQELRLPLMRAKSASAVVAAATATADADERDYADARSCCNSSCDSATHSSDSSDDDDGISTVYPDCEKSHSWNYRARISTCDVRRDIARAGIKSRADRIARIEQTDCDHQQQRPKATSNAASNAKRASLPATLRVDSSAQMPAVVSQINRLFEQAKRPEQRRSTKQHRAPAPPLSQDAVLTAFTPQSASNARARPPAQPLRPAPIPKKEPNMRMRGAREMLPSIEERTKRLSNSSAPADCRDCILESSANASEVRNMRCAVNEARFTRSSPEQRQQVSRIPKPISEPQQQHRHSTSSAQVYSEANEQLQRRIRQLFDPEQERKQQLQRQVTDEFRMQCAAEKIKLRATKSTAFEEPDKSKRGSADADAQSCDELDKLLPKQVRQPAAASFQKIKMERVHIRKKRQPLLIINQLNEGKPANNDKVKEESEPLRTTKCCATPHKVSKEAAHRSAPDGSRRTCGYKNCNYTNCPMSATSNAGSSSGVSTPHNSDEELSARKRLSLESCCSDSGVSSSTDLKERHTNQNNMKNLEKCADCVKILLNQAGAESTVMQHCLKLTPTAAVAAATPKLKELDADVAKGGQIKIRVGKAPGGDPNDVQNFAKKSLIKATTDELLTAAVQAAKNNTSNKVGAAVDKLSNRTAKASASNSTKQCNIENDLKNNEQRIYNNTNCNSSSHNNNKDSNRSASEQIPLCATTIKIDDDWLPEQNGCDADSLMVPPSPPLRTSSKHAPHARQQFHNSNNDNKHGNSTAGSSESDKHSVKIFVRSSASSSGGGGGGVGGNQSRASLISMCSYTSQASGCSSNSEASALTNASKTSASGSSYTTISSSASSSGEAGKCNCQRGRSVNTATHKEEDEEMAGETEDTDDYCSLRRMTKSGIFYNRAADREGTENDTLRVCAASPTPSADTFNEISCVACGEEAKCCQASISSGTIGGVFLNNSYFQQEAELVTADASKSTHKNGSELKARTPIDKIEGHCDDNEQCCCSLTSCDDDNCSYYECGGSGGDGSSAGEPQTDDDHCVSRIEVHASVHTPSSSSGSNGSGCSKIEGSDKRGADNSLAVTSKNKSADCECVQHHCRAAANSTSKDSNALEAERQHVRERERCAARQQQQLEQQWLCQRMSERERDRQMQFVRNSSAEEILIRNKHFLRKADLIHELRPRSMDGVIDSSSGSLNGDTNRSSPDSGNHIQNQQDAEARRIHRGHVLTELLETERIYVNEMASILKGYRDQMLSEEMMHLVPASLQGKEDILFGNLHELYTFHNEIFLKDLENCISTTELVALCFVQRRDTFYRLYSFYCQNIPRSDRLRETLVDTHLFLQECQKRLGHKLPLGAYLLKPVQRITKYKLLLENLLGSSDSGSCTKELQKALDCMLIVLRCVNDSMHQVAITGFPSNLSQQGELLLQDPFQVWTESKKDLRLRKKPQQRHIFLYQKSMIFCKKTSKPGHNKSTYQFKHQLKLSQIGLTESVRGDSTRFEVWLQGRQEVHTLQAPTEEVKNKWVTEIKRLLLNQLEELKGEKIKQYGMNHHGLRQTTSWDTPNILLGMPQRAVSCDASSESSNRNSNCSSSGDDVYPHGMPPPLSTVTGNGHAHGNSASGVGGDKEQQEACGWSSDYSNSEDEMSIIEDNSAPKPMQRVGHQRHIWNRSIENLLEARAAIRSE